MRERSKAMEPFVEDLLAMGGARGRGDGAAGADDGREGLDKAFFLGCSIKNGLD